MACCPAHQDTDPSLSIARGDDGKVLLHCFAGCSYGEIISTPALKDLFPGAGPRKTKRKPAKKEPVPEDWNKLPTIKKMSDIEPEEVSYLWEPYIPKRKLTLLEGDPGGGKTFLALQVAAAISAGFPLPGPDGRPTEKREPGKVLYMSAEDGLADTLRPRLDTMGADPENIHVLTGWKDYAADEEGLVTLEDTEVINKAMLTVNPDMVVIDPIQGYLGAGVDMHRANEIRPVLAKLADLAELHDSALLCIRHLSKAPTNKALYRGMGSIDFSAAARSILLAGQDPDNPEKRAIIHLKSSLTQTGPSIGYELSGEGFFWTGPSDMTAGSVLRAENHDEGDKTALEEAKEFLTDLLYDGPLPCKDIDAERKNANISKRTLDRAKSALGIISEKHGDNWSWRMPDKNVGTVGILPTSPDTREAEEECQVCQAYSPGNLKEDISSREELTPSQLQILKEYGEEV